MTTYPTTGLSDRGGAIETHVPGDPEAFHALASYLRESIGSRLEGLGNEVADQRSELADSWHGEAGAAFGQRAGTLVTACDQVYPQVLAGAHEIDSLGDTLRTVQQSLAGVRASASAAGCPVSGTLILRPVHPLKPGEIVSNIFDLTPEEHAQDAAFATAAETADEVWAQWYDRVNDAGGFIATRAADIVGFLSDLITAAATNGLRAISSSILTKQSDWLTERIAQNERHMAHYSAYLEKTGDRSIVFNHDLLGRENIDLRYAAEAAEAAAKDPHLPFAVRGSLGTLGALATGVGIYADVHDGESIGQAVTSQGAGLVLGTGSAVGAGMLAGSFIAPGLGTVGGAVVVGGAELIAGTAGAVLGDDIVDALWPDGDGDNQPSVAQQQGGTLLDYAGQIVTPARPGQGG